MIALEPTPEQRAIRDAAHRFAADVIRPVTRTYDASGEFPLPEVERAWKQGLLFGALPAEYGGLGLGLVDECLIAEEIAWGCAGFFSTWATTSLGTAPIIAFGSPTQKDRYLRGLLDKFRLCAFALSEPGAGSDAGGVACTARRVGDRYVLNGAKQWTTNGGVADFTVVFATLDRSKRHAGLCAFIVERGTPGFQVGRREQLTGIRCSDTRSLVFEDCEVPGENLLGREGEGFAVAQAAFQRSRPLVAAAATGLARAAMEHATRYALERQAGGKTLTSYQAIQLMLADMAIGVSASRLMTWNAAARIDRGEPAGQDSAMAKCFATDTAMRVASDAVQIYGGYGCSQDYPVEKLMRDAKVLQIIEGTNQVMRLMTAVELVKHAVRRDG